MRLHTNRLETWVSAVVGGGCRWGMAALLAWSAALAPADVGGGIGVAVSPDSTLAYVANGDGATLSVIYTATNTVAATVPVGNTPTAVLVVPTPGGFYVFVANTDSNTVSVIDTATNTVAATVPVGDSPLGLTFSGLTMNPLDAVILSVNMGDSTVTKITSSPPGAPTGISWSTQTFHASDYESDYYAVTDGYYIYTMDNATGSFSTYDFVASANVGSPTSLGVVGVGTTAMTLIPSVEIDSAPSILIANELSNTVSVLKPEPATGTVTVAATVPVGNMPQGLAVSADGTTAYVANAGDGTVSVINSVNNPVTIAVVGTVPVGNTPQGLAVRPDGGAVYVANAGDETVSAVDTATNTVAATVAATCNGQAPTTGCTVNGQANQPCQGTAADDTIVGTNGPDVIVGLGGNDTITGGNGDDLICGGSGNDTIHGDNGRDRLFGGGGDDALHGDHGDDALHGGGGTDSCDGGQGNDTITGGTCETVS